MHRADVKFLDAELAWPDGYGLNTLTAALRDGGMAQKRTRHSLKKKGMS